VCEPTVTLCSDGKTICERSFICHPAEQTCDSKSNWDFGTEPYILGWTFDPATGTCNELTGNATFATGRGALFGTKLECTQQCGQCTTTTCQGAVCENLPDGFACHAIPGSGEKKLCDDLTNFYWGDDTLPLGWGKFGEACQGVAGNAIYNTCLTTSRKECESTCLNGAHKFLFSDITHQAIAWIVVGSLFLLLAVLSFMRQNGWLVVCGIHPPQHFSKKGFLAQLTAQLQKETSSPHVESP